MARISKADCISVQDAQRELGIARTTLYNYLNILRIQRHRFPFDRNTYILLSDYERVKNFKENREI